MVEPNKQAPGSRRAEGRAKLRLRRPRPEQVNTTAAVFLDDVTLHYPGAERPALERVSLEVAAGEFVYVVGSSGSGKSSLLRSLYADQRPQHGRLHVVGTNLRRARPSIVAAHRRRLGVVFQDFKLLEARTVHDQVAFALTAMGRRKEATDLVPTVLDQVGLSDKAHRLPTELSGGEQQRVALARALVAGPQLLIADEPTGNLDPDSSQSIMEVLDRIHAAGVTIMMATHDEALVDSTGHRVVVMDAGRVVRDDTTGGYRDAGAA